MPAQFTCRQGHHWQPGAEGPTASRPALTCPVCGAPPALTAQELDVLNARPSSAPSRSSPNLADDPNATLPAVHVPSSEYDATLGVAADISPELRAAVPGYEILEEVGRGGMGVVYKARDVRLNRLVALKMILAGVHVGPRELVRFRSEAAAVAGLQHPNIVQIYEVGEHDGRPYLALEFVAGGSLAERMTGQPLPPLWAADLIQSLARAVEHAHQRGIVHRDLKPANILLQTTEHTEDTEKNDQSISFLSSSVPSVCSVVKITDFGLAKQLAAGAALTQSGTVLGTPSYMAPEQALGKNRVIGPAADIYALGAILYEMLTGQPPFRAETSLDTMLKVASEEPTPISRLQPRIPRDLQTICLKCLQKEPTKRYASAEALAEDLRRFLVGEPVQARPVGRVERTYKWVRRRPSLAALILLGITSVLLAFAGLAWMWHAEAEQVKRLASAQKETEAALSRAELNLYCNRIALAEREWLANNVPRARQLLRECPEALRQWEWHYLHHLCDSCLLTLHGVDSTIVSLAFDGRQHLAAIGEDQALRVWDTATGKTLLSQRDGKRRDKSAVLAYRSSGELHCASATQPVHVWDMSRPDKPQDQEWPRADVTVVGFSADQRQVVAGLKDGSVKIWDLSAGRELFRTQGHNSPITAVALSPGGKVVASGDESGQIILWDTATGHEIAQPHKSKQASAIRVLAFSPDGYQLASASGDPIVRLWETTTGNLIFTLHGHAQAVSSLAFSYSSMGRFLASGGRDQMVKVWDMQLGKEAFTLRGHTHPITCVAFSPDGRLLASAARDHTVKVWDATTGQESRTIPAHLTARSAAYRFDGKRLATADGEVAIWDPANAHLVRVFGGPKHFVEALAYSTDGKRLAVGGRHGLTIWDPVAKEEVRRLGDAGDHVRSVAYSPDGTQLAAAYEDGTARLWDPATGEELRVLHGHTAAVTSLAFSPDGRRLATASLDHDAKLWEVATGKEELTLSGHAGAVQAVAFSPRGDLLATGGASPGSADGETVVEGEVKVWDAHSGKLQHTLWGHTGEVTSVAFSPDGVRLATGCDDHTVKLWDPLLGQEVLTLRGHTSTVQAVVFSPDGHHLVSTGADQTVRIWNATPGG